MIIKWKIFETSEECEKWQEANPNVAISTMQPIIKRMDNTGWEGAVSDNEKNTVFKGEPTYVVFVTYFNRPSGEGPRTM